MQYFQKFCFLLGDEQGPSGSIEGQHRSGRSGDPGGRGDPDDYYYEVWLYYTHFNYKISIILINDNQPKNKFIRLFSRFYRPNKLSNTWWIQ